MDKIRFAVVGLGRMGRGHVAGMLAADGMFELAAICDNAPDRLENLPGEMKDVKKKYSSIEQVLADKDIDLVTIGTRHLEHVPMAIQILEAGKYCVIEKPVATSEKEMLKLKACADKHPGKLFLRHNRRFEPAFIKAKALVDSGMLGKINYIKLYRSVGYCRRNDWMTVPELYGGLLSNWGPHLIDQALQFLDSPVKDVWADVRHCISIGAGDDLFKILLKSENGRLADIEVTGANTMPGREMEIICERGTLVFENEKMRVRMVDPSVKFKPLKPHWENPPLQYGNFEEQLYFVESTYDIPKGGIDDVWKHIGMAILKGIPYPVKFEEGLAVVRVTDEVIRKSGFAPLLPFLD